MSPFNLRLGIIGLLLSLHFTDLLITPVEYFDELESLINSIKSEDKNTIMLGDTNCNFLNNSDNDTKHLKRILMTYRLTQLINIIFLTQHAKIIQGGPRH